MTRNERIKLLKTEPPENCSKIDYYQQMLKKINGIKYNYFDFMITHPINCATEIKRTSVADYELCCALFTMLFREDRFAGNGCFDRWYESGDVKMIIDRMIFLLEREEE